MESVEGQSRDPHIRLKRLPSKADLRELIALRYRYKMDMTTLAAMRTPGNAKWFDQDPKAYWHSPVLGKPRRKAPS